MFIDNNYIKDDDMIADESKFLRKINNIYITEEQVNILKKYGIDINKYKTISELIYTIENYLNNSVESLDDLDWVSQSLSEYNYYNNTNK